MFCSKDQRFYYVIEAHALIFITTPTTVYERSSTKDMEKPESMTVYKNKQDVLSML